MFLTQLANSNKSGSDNIDFRIKSDLQTILSTNTQQFRPCNPKML